MVGNIPAVFYRPCQILPLPQRIFKLAIMRPVDIHAMLLKATVEEINHKPHRDLAQPEVVWREER